MNVKKLITIVLIIMLAMFIKLPISNAAGLTIAFSKSNVTVGETINVTVNGNGISGKISLSVSGNATLSQNSIWVENSSQTVTATITGEGSIRITATPEDAADSATAAPFTTATSGTLTATTSSSNNPTSNNDSNTKPAQKSSNANLSNLGIRPNDFTGFKPGTTTYQVEVPENVTEVEVYATAQHAKASISGTGKKSLNVGANAFNVVVTAEDGTKKTYTINVTRQGEVEEENPEDTTSEEEETEQAKGLAELKIDNLSLSPAFETGVYEYQVKYIGQDTELNITTKATQEDYIVEVTGNEDLKEGENIITILVSDKDGNNVATYQVTVNKSLVDEEAIAREEAKKQEEFRKTVIIGSIIAVVVIAIIVFLIIRHKRNQRFAEEYSGVPFSGLNEDEDWQNSNQGWEDDEQQEVKEEEMEQDESTLDNLSQEELKNRYLDNYNKDSLEENFYEEEKPRKTRHKGKRFK